MKQSSLIFFVFLILVNMKIKGQGVLKEKSAELQSILDQTVDNKKIFGASFCIKYKGEVWSGLSGNLKNDDQYFIASTTKMFVTAIILQLVSERKLSLDDKINKYLDTVVMNGLHIYKGVDYSNELTIKNLLAHTSGLADYFQNIGTNGKSLEEEIVSGEDQFWTFEEAVQRTKAIKPLFAPNTKGKAHYSDANFQLLGKIIENITSKTFEENCEERIFKPLNLTKTYMYCEIGDTNPKTLYYKQNELYIPKAMTSFRADGGMVSTSTEMMTFLEAFFKGKLFPINYIEDLKQWNKIFSPLQSGVGIHLFALPKILGIPELIGHSGLSGALAYYDAKNDFFVTGTVNQIAYPSTSFTVVTKFIQTTLSEKKKKKIETVSAVGIGTTYSTIQNNNGNSKVGFTIDLYKEYKLIKPISFTTEIMYSQKGERSSNDLSNIRLHYLELPLMLKLNLMNNKFGLSSGFSTNFLLASNKETQTFQRLEYTIPFAINYRMADFLQLSFKYNIGLTDIAKNNYINQGFKNNYFIFSLLLVNP